MTSPAKGARDLIVAAGVGVTGANPSGWSVFLSRMSDIPDRQVVFYDTGGQDPSPAWLLDYPTIQAIIRGEQDDYVNTYAKAKDIFDVLVGLPSQDLNGDRWVSVQSMGGINNLGYDDKNRPKLSINFRLIIEPATSVLAHRQAL